MARYTNSVTYTAAGKDGTRYESTTRIDRDRVLTARGAERILRRERGDDTVIVVRVEAMAYA